MKIQIDTNEKTLTIEQDLKISELIEVLNKLFPDGEWKEYTLKTEIINNWTYPIYIERYPSCPGYWKTIFPYPWYPITYDTTGDYQVQDNYSGVYNVEIN